MVHSRENVTQRRGAKEGKIAAIPITEVERLLGELRAGIILLYGWVSGHDQKEGLQRQVKQLEQWAGVSRTGQKTILSDG